MNEVLYPPFPILIVDDEIRALEGIEFALNFDGVNNLILCSDSREVANILEENDVGVILLDLLMPYLSGEELLPQITELYPDIPVIITTGVNDLETAVRCMKSKAYDFLLKPMEDNRLTIEVRKAIQLREMKAEINHLKRRVLNNTLDNPEYFSEIITQNKEMLSIFQYIESVAKSTQPVLVTGETGVGKELVAKSIHRCSERKGEFVTISIAGLDETVFSDTLFGHLKGAFTDAKTSRKGLVEQAAGGTLFLDEIGDLRPESQVMLLRLVDTREYLPLGSDVVKKGDVRIIAATNVDLKKPVEKGTFRNDLFYRLNSHHIRLPPLRKRIDDLAVLLDHFLEMAASDMKKKKPTPPPELAKLLSSYHFPGNIRELKSMVFDAVANHKSKMLNMDFFKNYINSNRAESVKALKSIHHEDLGSLATWKKLPTIKEMTQMLIMEAIKRAEGNKSLAAQILGITRQTMVKYMKQLR